MEQHFNIHDMLSAIGDIFAETAWPTRCAICDTPGNVLCEECESNLHLIDACKACPRCGAPYGIVQCSECNDVILGLSGRERFPLDGFASPFILDDGARRIITAYKDHDEHRLCNIIADYMARYINPDWIGNAEWRNQCDDSSAQACITFIPSTKAAYRRRGFDHAENIARKISDITGLQCRPLLQRPKNIDQRKLGRAQRSANIAGKFRLLQNDISDTDLPLPARVVLVDDICTTGATMYAAADALRESGVERIYGLAFGKVIA